MKHFSPDTTEGYTNEQLTELRSRFEAACYKHGISPDADNLEPSEDTMRKHLAEQVFAQFDSDGAPEIDRRTYAQKHADFYGYER